MDKKLKDMIKTAKTLHKKGLIYMNDSIELKAEPNYQIVASIVKDLNLCMDKKKYELIKNDKDELIHKLALINFNEDDLVSNVDVQFMENIIKEYVDLLDPILVYDMYAFTAKMDKLQELYEKAFLQVKEGKFKNVIF